MQGMTFEMCREVSPSDLKLDDAGKSQESGELKPVIYTWDKYEYNLEVSAIFSKPGKVWT